MPDYDNTNSGALFQCKEGSKCDFSGQLDIEGDEHKLFADKEEGGISVDVMGDQAKIATIKLKQVEQKTEKHPKYKGSLLINDGEYKIAGWPRKYANGTKHMLSLQATKQGAQDSSAKNDAEDDAPF